MYRTIPPEARMERVAMRIGASSDYLEGSFHSTFGPLAPRFER